MVNHSVGRLASYALAIYSWNVIPQRASKLLLCLLLAVPGVASATALETLAQSMQPGEFRELQTNNLSSGMLFTGRQHILQYASQACWDSARGEFSFMGHGHIEPGGGHIRYTESTNSWELLPAIAPTMGGMWGYHANDSNTIDPNTGDTFVRGNDLGFDRYDRSAESWYTLPRPSVSNFQVAGPLNYFPEIGGLVWVDSAAGVLLYRPSSNDWETITGPEAISGIGPHSNWGSYDPVNKVVLFGGGNGSSMMWKLDTARRVTRLSNSPMTLNLQSTAEFHTDTGKLITFFPDGSVWDYSVTSDTWRQVGSHPLNNIGIAAGPIVAPVPEHGVAFILKDANNPKVLLYKFSDGSEVVSRPSAPGNVRTTFAN